MACEKLCKAYRISHGADISEVRKSHAFIAGTLPIIALHILSREAGRMPRETWVISAIRKLARQIELLAPAVRDGGRVESNCEYPWVIPSGDVIAPCNYNFGIDLLYQRAGRTLLKIIRIAIDELLQQH